MSQTVTPERLRDTPVNFFTDEDWNRLGQSAAAEAFLLRTADAADFYSSPARRYQHPLYSRVKEMADALDEARIRITNFSVDACLPDELDLDVKDDLALKVQGYVVSGLIWGSLFARYATLEDGRTMEVTNNQGVGERS